MSDNEDDDVLEDRSLNLAQITSWMVQATKSMDMAEIAKKIF